MIGDDVMLISTFFVISSYEDNAIDAEGASALARALKVNEALKSLDLRRMFYLFLLTSSY